MVLLTFSAGLGAEKIAKVCRGLSVEPPVANSTLNQTQADQAPLPHAPTHNQLEPPSLSPYDIGSFINAQPGSDLTNIWQGLGIRKLNIGGNEKPDANESKFLTQCGNCQAESFEYELDGEGGSEVLLRIEDRLKEECRYLVFKWVGEGMNEWRLLGHIDHDFGRYRMPQHLVLLSGGRPWLVIQGQGASGSGVALYFDRVFLITRNRLAEVISYNSEGHQSDFEYTKEFSGHIVSCGIEDGLATAEIEFFVTYFAGDYSKPSHPITLFAKSQKAVLLRRLSNRVATLDVNHSELTHNELDAVYNIDSLSNEDFLKYNYQELSRIAQGTDTKRREWLRQFLDACDNTAEQRRLGQLLAR